MPIPTARSSGVTNWCFHAGTITARLLEDDVLHVGWVAATDNDEHLIMMRGPDDSTYCLVATGGVAVYGGCRAVRVDDASVELDLAPEAASALGVGDGVRITWDPGAAPAELKDVVARILAESGPEQ